MNRVNEMNRLIREKDYRGYGRLLYEQYSEILGALNQQIGTQLTATLDANMAMARLSRAAKNDAMQAYRMILEGAKQAATESNDTFNANYISSKLSEN